MHRATFKHLSSAATLILVALIVLPGSAVAAHGLVEPAQAGLHAAALQTTTTPAATTPAATATAAPTTAPTTAPTSVPAATTTPAPATTATTVAAAIASSHPNYQLNYSDLRADLYGMDETLAEVEGYGARFSSFINDEHHQSPAHDTTILDSSLVNFNSYVGLAWAARKAGIIAISGNPGLDSQGAITEGGSEYDAAVKDGNTQDWTARSYINLAMGELHGALNLYHQVWGYDIPDIPAWKLAPYGAK